MMTTIHPLVLPVGPRLEAALTTIAPPSPLSRIPVLSLADSAKASPFPAPRRLSSSLHADPCARPSASPATAATTSTTTLTSLPSELLLHIASFLYLPPTSFASAHERNASLRALGLAAGHRAHGLVRELLFCEVSLRSEREVRWLVRRRDELGRFVRCLTVTGSKLSVHLGGLLAGLPALVSLRLTSRLSLAVASDLLPRLGALAPGLRALDISLSEPFSAGFVGLLAEGVGRELERLEVATRFVKGGLMAHEVRWEEEELRQAFESIAPHLPALRHLSLPVLVLPPPRTYDPDLDPPYAPVDPEPYRAALLQDIVTGDGGMKSSLIAIRLADDRGRDAVESNWWRIDEGWQVCLQRPDRGEEWEQGRYGCFSGMQEASCRSRTMSGSSSS